MQIHIDDTVYVHFYYQGDIETLGMTAILKLEILSFPKYLLAFLNILWLSKAWFYLNTYKKTCSTWQKRFNMGNKAAESKKLEFTQICRSLYYSAFYRLLRLRPCVSSIVFIGTFYPWMTSTDKKIIHHFFPWMTLLSMDKMILSMDDFDG